MKKFFLRALLVLLVIMAGNDNLMAQRRHYSAPRRHHSVTGDILRGLDAADRIADYAMTGVMLHKLDDYTGIRFGLNSASLRASGFDGADTDNIVGADLGFVFGWYLGHSPFIIEPGIFYSMKGGKLAYDIDVPNIANASQSLKMKMHNFEIPVVLKAGLPLGPHSQIEPFIGPFLSFGFAGTTTETTSGSIGNLHNRETEDYDTFDDYLDDFDAGLRLGAGICVGHFYLEAAYDIGFVNLCDDNWEHRNSLNSRTWSFNIGYNF